MQCLSDNALLDAYFKALELKLDSDFLNLLTDELNRRGIAFDKLQSGEHTGQVSIHDEI
ncbi:sporulation histidine kinase inhibitor Sda [Lentibacillus sp. Marseille-P4043]|uniref:sporulation histidine kinase inhibitor Sda n=1 Tax=Lentibacillus sp. Marseille-P4043 TaxID=2040293 RepID=UPI000D0BC5B1|nr:sporulation histidine kinase inhibitor Sda [Lentibacillus sp. Marseille-P4043]